MTATTARSPLWLATPSRYAGMTRNRARAVLLLLVVAMAATLTALAAPAPPPATPDPDKPGQNRADIALYQTMVAGVRAGGDYYRVAAHAQRTGYYPVRPFFTMRLPTMVVLLALIPPWLAPLLLWGLCAGVIAAWYRRLQSLLPGREHQLMALLLLASGMMAFVDRELVFFHEIWAGLLIALSLAVWRPGRWIESAGIALIAMLIRETAALLPAVMCLMALIEGRRREALGWIATAVVLAIAVFFHAEAWARVVRPDDSLSAGWLGLLGYGFFVRTMTLVTGLAIFPLWAAAPLVVLSIFGWSALRDPIGGRVVALFAAYGLLLAVFCRVDTYYWAMLIAPPLLVGLAFAVDGVRDLVAAAGSTRRITVTRTTP
ncbi:MAG: hypothetical protein V4459_09130 [Pseudomonadota bacterium]